MRYFTAAYFVMVCGFITLLCADKGAPYLGFASAALGLAFMIAGVKDDEGDSA